MYNEIRTIYSKLDTCIEGIKLNFNALSVADYGSRLATIQLYPNPTTDKLEILNPTQIPIESYSVLDMSGKLLLHRKYNSTIPISEFPSGLYLLELKTKQGKITRKFLKQ